jgi:lysophospholipase L1-like esterase
MPTTPLFEALGVTSAGTIDAAPGSVSLADPAFAGPLLSAQMPAGQPYGVLYNVSSWTSLTDFSLQGSPTASVVSNKIQFGGGTGGTYVSMDRLPYTCLPRWKMTARILTGAISGTSYGIGLGMHSYNANGYYCAIGRIDLSSNATAGKLYFGMTLAGSAEADQAGSATGLTWTAGDYIVLTVTRDEDLFTVEAYDDTTASAPITLTYRVPVFYPQTYILPNTGRHGIFSFGGTQTLDSLKIESQTPMHADLAIVGDSKSGGYYPGAYAQGYARLLGSSYTIANLSGGADKTADVLLRVPEIIALAPRAVLLNIARNDIGFSVASGTYISNYDSIVSQLTSAGIKVFHLLPLFETAVDQTTLTNHITSTYANYIDPQLSKWSGTASNILAPDNVHPNGFANIKIAKAVRDYFGAGDRITPVTAASLAGSVRQYQTTPMNGTVVDWALNGPFTLTLTANTTLTFANGFDGQDISVAVTNTGSYTLTWPAIKWVAGTAPTQTTGAHTDVYTFRKMGSAIYGSVTQNY